MQSRNRLLSAIILVYCLPGTILFGQGSQTDFAEESSSAVPQAGSNVKTSQNYIFGGTSDWNLFLPDESTLTIAYNLDRTSPVKILKRLSGDAIQRSIVMKNASKRTRNPYQVLIPNDNRSITVVGDVTIQRLALEAVSSLEAKITSKDK